MRKRKHVGGASSSSSAGFRHWKKKKGPKKTKFNSSHQNRDLSSKSKNAYSRKPEEEEEKDTTALYSSSSSSDEGENPFKQLVSELCKNSTRTSDDELSDDFVKQEEEEEEEGAEIGEEEEEAAEMGEEEEEAEIEEKEEEETGLEEEEEEEDEMEEEEDEEAGIGDEEEAEMEEEEEGAEMGEEEEEEGAEIDEEEEEEEAEMGEEEEGAEIGEEEGAEIQEEEEEEETGMEEEEEDGIEEEEEEEDVEEGQEDDDDDDKEEEEEVNEAEEDNEEEREEEENDLSDDEEEEKEEKFASSSSEDSDLEIEEENQIDNSTGEDPFVRHFESVIPDKFVEKLDAGKGWQKEPIKLPFGKGVSIWNDNRFKAQVLKSSENNLQELHVKQKLIDHLQNKKDDNNGTFSPLQNQLFQFFNSYQDFYYPQKNVELSKEVEMVYCLHVINHVLKSRSQVINHDIKLKTRNENKNATEEEFQDQGLMRPKVLILVPFRETARRIISNFIQILGNNTEIQTDSKKRFFNEFSLQEEEIINEKKPEDYKTIFAGNTDDHFRIGVGLSRKRFKLYTKFYSSDIIIASPLGLRTVMESDQNSKEDYDFLSSIEILILDQTDIFLMQNWEHLMNIISHLHLQPKESHDCDFSRVRLWSLNGWSKYYRQTIILSSLPSPPISLIFNKHCFNYAGKLQVYPAPSSGTICQVAMQLPLVFHRLESLSYDKSADARFNMFIKKILPKFQDNSAMHSTMLFIPSYFDFVRIRNHFNKKEIKFLQINEYSNQNEVARTRSQFFLGKTPFLLYTERHHFYFRPRIRGVRHVIFYELPLYSHFFSEVCNMMYDSKSKKASKNDTTSLVLYSKYDAQRLAGVIGTDRATIMINSPKALHMFVTDS